jgi:para-aminobenzoate synthetase component I
MLNWANRFGIFCFLDNHQYPSHTTGIECMLAAGMARQFKPSGENILLQLQNFLNEKPAWIFGHLGYDLKNEIENLRSAGVDRLGFEDLYFFEPEILIRLSPGKLMIEQGGDSQKIMDEIMSAEENDGDDFLSGDYQLQHRFSKSEYLQTIHQVQQHIQKGDCYELNFCQEFFMEDVRINPLQVFENLSAVSPNPFSALYKLEDKFLVCASPERFLRKQGNKILSQPIKGTSPRYVNNHGMDQQSKSALIESEKDRTENVMVVDLVRNDLSKVCTRGSVQVDELFGVYSFPQVHQLISTVSGELKEGTTFEKILRATFPMGSMTGAPKKRVMELIEKYERSRRGIFSGALGYFTPGGDFDFNVVIRSIMYNETGKYLSFMAGSGITFYSDAEKEYEECLLKAEAMKKALMKNRL